MTDETTTTPAEGQVEGGSTQVAATKPWYDGLAEEDVGFIQNKKWETVADPVKAYRELEKFRGVPADKLVILPKDNDLKAWEQVFTKLGRPADPTKYGEVIGPEGETVQLNKERVEWADQVVHKLGLTKAQRDALYIEAAKFEQTALEDHKAAKMRENDAELMQLKKDWGGAYEEREELGRRAVRAFLPSDPEKKGELLSKIEDAIGTSTMLKLFANIGQKLGEDKMPVQDNSTRSFGYSREQALADKAALLTELAGDRNRLAVYNQAKGPDYAKMQSILKVISA